MSVNEHEFLHIAIAQVESVVKPDTVTDDLRRKAVVLMVCPRIVSTDLEMLWLLSRFGDLG
jgi:hypothetical protein